jgi:hypothetical protein
MGGEEMLAIDRDPKTKNLVVSMLRVFDDRGNIIARIDTNGFWVANTSRKKRPDESTLVVFDHNDIEVLNIKFLNPSAIKILGTFRKDRYPPIIIAESWTEVRGFRFAGSACIGPVETLINER